MEEQVIKVTEAIMDRFEDLQLVVTEVKTCGLILDQDFEAINSLSFLLSDSSVNVFENESTNVLSKFADSVFWAVDKVWGSISSYTGLDLLFKTIDNDQFYYRFYLDVFNKQTLLFRKHLDFLHRVLKMAKMQDGSLNQYDGTQLSNFSTCINIRFPKRLCQGNIIICKLIIECISEIFKYIVEEDNPLILDMIIELDSINPPELDTLSKVFEALVKIDTIYQLLMSNLLSTEVIALARLMEDTHAFNHIISCIIPNLLKLIVPVHETMKQQFNEYETRVQEFPVANLPQNPVMKNTMLQENLQKYLQNAKSSYDICFTLYQSLAQKWELSSPEVNKAIELMAIGSKRSVLLCEVMERLIIREIYRTEHKDVSEEILRIDETSDSEDIQTIRHDDLLETLEDQEFEGFVDDVALENPNSSFNLYELDNQLTGVERKLLMAELNVKLKEVQAKKGIQKYDQPNKFVLDEEKAGPSKNRKYNFKAFRMDTEVEQELQPLVSSRLTNEEVKDDQCHGRVQFLSCLEELKRKKSEVDVFTEFGGSP